MSTLLIVAISILAALAGAGIGHLAMRIETKNQFEVDEFAKFTDAFRGRK